jgi:hypothetical protein
MNAFEYTNAFGWGTALAVPFRFQNDTGFSVRTTIERKRWSKHHQNSSRVAAGYESPARKCRVKWNRCASPVGTTRVLTQTL